MTGTSLNDRFLEAVGEGDLARAEALLAQGADLHAKTANGQTALHRAANHIAEALVRPLAARGAVLDAQDRLGRTPLHLAASGGCPVVVETLLSLGAAADLSDGDGLTPFAIALRDQNALVLDAFLSGGWSPETEGLRAAALAGSPCALDRLSALAPGQARPDGALLASALRAGRGDLLDRLIDLGAPVDGRGEGGATALHLACALGDPQAARRLLERGADPQAADDAGRTPLHVLGSATPELVALLLEGGAQLHARDGQGLTPLEAAIEDDRPLALACLAAAWTPKDPLADAPGWTELHFAAACGSPAAIGALVRAGRLIERGEGGATLLHAAAMLAAPGAVAALLRAGLAPDARDPMGETALHVAVSAEDAHVLIHAGAPLTVRNSAGLTPAQSASARGAVAVLEEILRAAPVRGGGQPK